MDGLIETERDGMQRVLVIGASGGIGSALAETLAQRDAEVIGLSRSKDGLDITSEQSVGRHLSALKGEFDGIFVTTGALEIAGAAPEKSMKVVTGSAMMDQFALNTVGPALVIRHAMRLLPRKRRSVLAVLSARVGSIGDNRLGGWVSYRSSKAALNQVVRTASIELARSHPQHICVALHPGTVSTAFTQKYLGRHPSVAPGDAAANLIAVIEGLTADKTGGFFDWSGQEVPW